MAIINNDDFRFEKLNDPSVVREHETALFAKRMTEIPSNMQMRVDYNFPNKTQRYIGYAAKGIATSATGWLIQQILYSLASFPNQPSARTIAYGIWDDRATETYT